MSPKVTYSGSYRQEPKRLRAATVTPRGTLLTRKYIIISSAGRAEVFDTEERWIPGTPFPKDRQPNPLLALCRNAEAACGLFAEEKERFVA